MVMSLLRTQWQKAVAILHEAPLESELDLPSYRSTVRRDYADIAYQIAQVKAGALELIGVTGTNGKTTTTQLIHSTSKRTR